MSVLDQICLKKRTHVESKKSLRPFKEIQYAASKATPVRGFLKALEASHPLSIIAEIKKASPSKGVICADFNPVEIARAYENAGAACLSVLTDEPYFQGHDDYLKAVKETTSLPILRKDFMIDPYQIYESRALGADCILIIMAALDDTLARDLHDLALELGMDALVEVHNEEELERTHALKPRMIGVNNRNLKTLDVTLQTSFDLISMIPESCFKISESGIRNTDDLQSLKVSGYQGFLIGESLMTAADTEKTLKNLLTQTKN